MGSDNFDILISNLEAFSKKYYRNLLFRGLIIVFACLLSLALLESVSEYFAYFSGGLRKLLFYSFIGLSISLLVVFVVRPFLSYYKIISRMDYVAASEIIGSRFPEVKDKLINTLQLHEMYLHAQKDQLLAASLQQRTVQLNAVSFSSAIDAKEPLKYITLLSVPIIATLAIGLVAPAILLDGSKRIIRNDRYFSRPAPFQFAIVNKSLQVVAGENYTLTVKVHGAEIPGSIFFLEGDTRIPLIKDTKTQFHLSFEQIGTSKEFSLSAEGFASPRYFLRVLPRPSLLNARVSARYPPYIHRKEETFSSVEDMTLPEGSLITWSVRAKDATSIAFITAGRRFAFNPTGLPTTRGLHNFVYLRPLITDLHYALEPGNDQIKGIDSVAYDIKMIKDVPPEISVTERKDSLNDALIYFIGSLRDDYGFSALTFHYCVVNSKTAHSVAIPLASSANNQPFFFSWNYLTAKIPQGADVSYYFEVADNDALHGPKRTRSSLFTLHTRSDRELDALLSKQEQSIAQQLSKAASLSQQLEKSAHELSDKLLNKNTVDFEDKKAANNLIAQQKTLEDLVKEIKDSDKQVNKDNNAKDDVHKAIDQLLDEKTTKELSELAAYLKNNEKNETRQFLQNIRWDTKGLLQELDRIQALYKQMTLQKDIKKDIDRLRGLSDQEKNLASRNQEGSKKKADLSTAEKEQKGISDQFKQVDQSLQRLDKEDKKAEAQTGFSDPQKEKTEISKDLDDAAKALSKNNPKKAAGSQNSGADKMKSLADQLAAQQSEAQTAALSANLQSLRLVLQNLLRASFDQEDLMSRFKTIHPEDPLYPSLVQKQNDLRDNIKMIQDSVFSISKKVPQIEAFVNKQTSNIHRGMSLATADLADKKTFEALVQQQYVMTAINELAVMLGHAEKQLSQAMKKPGAGSGQSGLSLGELAGMQEALNKQMQQNVSKSGKEGEMNEALAKMAGEQQAIRQALESIKERSNPAMSGQLGNVEKNMEATETDLYNKNLGSPLVERQKQILTRLLAADKGSQEQGFDNKRASKKGGDVPPAQIAALKEYAQLKASLLEMLKTLPPGLNSYYKSKINTYFKQLNEGK